MANNFRIPDAMYRRLYVGVTNKFIPMSEEDQKIILCNNDLPNPKRYSRTISYNSTSPEINLTYRTIHIIKGFPGLRLAATLR